MSDANPQPLRHSQEPGTTLTSWQAGKALSRAMISGYVDAYALLNFGVFVSFMTGNTTSGGVRAGQAELAAAGHNLLPIPCFVLGILAGTLLVRSDPARALRRLTVVVAAMLAVGVARAYFAWPEWIGIVVLSSAMGILNASITRVGGQAVSLGFMTGDLNNLARHFAGAILRQPVEQAQGQSDTHWRRAALLGGLWAVFLAGAVVEAALGSRTGVWTLLPPALALLALGLLEPAATTAAR